MLHFVSLLSLFCPPGPVALVQVISMSLGFITTSSMFGFGYTATEQVLVCNLAFLAPVIGTL